jgi:L-malate glycosyltransferase
MGVTAARRQGARSRIVMVVRLFDPWVGGMERQALKLARELVACGIEVEILTGRWFRGTPRVEVRDGVRITRHQTLWEFGGVRGLRKLGGYLYLVTLVLALWRRRRDTAVIHVHGCNYHTAGAVVAGRLIGAPVVVKLANSGRGSDLAKLRRGAQLAFSGVLLPVALRADRFVAINPEVREELRAEGVAAERIVEIPNGVDMGPVRPRPDAAAVAKVVFVGRLHEQKGLGTLLAAAAHIRRQRPDLAFRIELLGEGPEEARLREHAARLDLDGHVRFRGHRDDVAAELAAADVFVLPSRAEGISNALLEALSVGAPAVVSDLPGNRAVIVHERSGLIVPVDEPGPLAQALIRLLEDEGLRDRLGTAGRRTIEERFTIGAVAAAYAALYGELGADVGAVVAGVLAAPGTVVDPTQTELLGGA